MTASTGADVGAEATRDDGPYHDHVSAAADGPMNGSVATGDGNDEGTGGEDETADEADQARFVAFVLHSLAGESSLDLKARILRTVDWIEFRLVLPPERKKTLRHLVCRGRRPHAFNQAYVRCGFGCVHASYGKTKILRHPLSSTPKHTNRTCRFFSIYITTSTSPYIPRRRASQQ